MNSVQIIHSSLFDEFVLKTSQSKAQNVYKIKWFTKKKYKTDAFRHGAHNVKNLYILFVNLLEAW